VELESAAEDGSMRYVFKISSGYTYENVEFMCETAAHLGSVGCRDCCLPIPKLERKQDLYMYDSQKEANGVPSFLFSYVEGQQADKIMHEYPHLASNVMCSIGAGLGRIHAASAGIDKNKANELGLRYKTDGGCCDVEDEYHGSVLNKILSDPDVQQHEFVHFYQKELVDLKGEMELVRTKARQ